MVVVRVRKAAKSCAAVWSESIHTYNHAGSFLMFFFFFYPTIPYLLVKSWIFTHLSLTINIEFFESLLRTADLLSFQLTQLTRHSRFRLKKVEGAHTHFIIALAPRLNPQHEYCNAGACFRQLTANTLCIAPGKRLDCLDALASTGIHMYVIVRIAIHPNERLQTLDCDL